MKTTFYLLISYFTNRSGSCKTRIFSAFIFIDPFFSTYSFLQQHLAKPAKKHRQTIYLNFKIVKLLCLQFFRKRCSKAYLFLLERSNSTSRKDFFSSILYTVISNTLPLQYPVEAYMKNYEKPTNLTIADHIGFLR